MVFARHLRPLVRAGAVTCSVRVWRGPRVKVGHAYPMEEGHVVVDAIRPIALDQVTGDLARRSGFLGVVDLLKTARHGSGTNIYLIDFHFVGPTASPAGGAISVA